MFDPFGLSEAAQLLPPPSHFILCSHQTCRIRILIRSIAAAVHFLDLFTLSISEVLLSIEAESASPSGTFIVFSDHSSSVTISRIASTRAVDSSEFRPVSNQWLSPFIPALAGFLPRPSAIPFSTFSNLIRPSLTFCDLRHCWISSIFFSIFCDRHINPARAPSSFVDLRRDSTSFDLPQTFSQPMWTISERHWRFAIFQFAKSARSP
jgi:hypothetical protein